MSASRKIAVANTSIPRMLRSWRFRNCPMMGASSRKLTRPISSGSSSRACSALSRVGAGSLARGAERTPVLVVDARTAWQRRTYQQPVVHTSARRRGGLLPLRTAPSSWSSMTWITRWRGQGPRSRPGRCPNPPGTPHRGAGDGGDEPRPGPELPRRRCRGNRPPRLRRDPSGAGLRREDSFGLSGRPERHRCLPCREYTRQIYALPCIDPNAGHDLAIRDPRSWAPEDDWREGRTLPSTTRVADAGTRATEACLRSSGPTGVPAQPGLDR